MPEKVKELQAKLADWRKQVGAKMPTPHEPRKGEPKRPRNRGSDADECRVIRRDGSGNRSDAGDEAGNGGAVIGSEPERGRDRSTPLRPGRRDGRLEGAQDDLAVALHPLGAGDLIGDLEGSGTAVHRVKLNRPIHTNAMSVNLHFG